MPFAVCVEQLLHHNDSFDSAALRLFEIFAAPVVFIVSLQWYLLTRISTSKHDSTLATLLCGAILAIIYLSIAYLPFEIYAGSGDLASWSAELGRAYLLFASVGAVLGLTVGKVIRKWKSICQHRVAG